MQKYDANKVESAIKIIMKQLASTLSKQRGVQYEFGSEYEEHTAKKQASTLESTHLKPLSEIFSEEQLDTIPIERSTLGS